jgi:hypothetical protein
MKQIAFNKSKASYRAGIRQFCDEVVNILLMRSLLFQMGVDSVFMLDTSTEFFILRLTISERERASENCIASGCVINGKEEMAYLSFLPDIMLFSFPTYHKSTEFITGQYILSRKHHLPAFECKFGRYS